jgi:hypothetical protein
MVPCARRVGVEGRSMSATRARVTAPPLPSIIDLALHAGAVTATYQRPYDVVERDRRAPRAARSSAPCGC